MCNNDIASTYAPDDGISYILVDDQLDSLFSVAVLTTIKTTKSVLCIGSCGVRVLYSVWCVGLGRGDAWCVTNLTPVGQCRSRIHNSRSPISHPVPPACCEAELFVLLQRRSVGSFFWQVLNECQSTTAAAL